MAGLCLGGYCGNGNKSLHERFDFFRKLFYWMSDCRCRVSVNQAHTFRNVTVVVVDSIKERCLQWVGGDCWRMRFKDNMNPTIFMY